MPRRDAGSRCQVQQLADSLGLTPLRLMAGGNSYVTGSATASSVLTLESQSGGGGGGGGDPHHEKYNGNDFTIDSIYFSSLASTNAVSTVLDRVVYVTRL